MAVAPSQLQNTVTHTIGWCCPQNDSSQLCRARRGARRLCPEGFTPTTANLSEQSRVHARDPENTRNSFQPGRTLSGGEGGRRAGRKGPSGQRVPSSTPRGRMHRDKPRAESRRQRRRPGSSRPGSRPSDQRKANADPARDSPSVPLT